MLCGVTEVKNWSLVRRWKRALGILKGLGLAILGNFV